MLSSTAQHNPTAPGIRSHSDSGAQETSPGALGCPSTLLCRWRFWSRVLPVVELIALRPWVSGAPHAFCRCGVSVICCQLGSVNWCLSVWGCCPKDCCKPSGLCGCGGQGAGACTQGACLTQGAGGRLLFQEGGGAWASGRMDPDSSTSFRQLMAQEPLEKRDLEI